MSETIFQDTFTEIIQNRGEEKKKKCIEMKHRYKIDN